MLVQAPSHLEQLLLPAPNCLEQVHARTEGGCRPPHPGPPQMVPLAGRGRRTAQPTASGG
eukprot:12437897-Alexandrium_andersonii.AAC.1